MTSSVSSWCAQAVPSAALILAVLTLWLIRFASPWRWVAVALGLVVADQAAKALEPLLITAQGGMRTLFFLGGWVRVHYGWNGEQGFGDAYPHLLAVSIFCSAGLLWFYRWLGRERYRMSAATEIGCAMVLGGLLGILIDRIRLGYTVDFLRFGRGGQFVYNLADLAVMAGATVLLLRTVHFAVTNRGKGFPLALVGAEHHPQKRPSRRQRLWLPAGIVLAAGAALCVLWRATPEPRLPPLHDAAARGDVSEVERLLAGGADVNASCGPWHETALDLAIFKGQTATVRVLLEQGAEASPESLHNAAMRRDPELVRMLLEHGESAAATGPGGTPLIWNAAFSGNAETVKLLLSAGADPNARNTDGTTPLHRAAASGDAALVQALIAGGAEVNARDARGRTPLLMASGAWQKKGDTLSINTELGRAVTLALLERGADPNVRADDGWTPLTRAATRGDAGWVKALLDGGADPDARGPGGWTALHYAAARGSREVVETLLAAGAAVNSKDDSGSTPLSLAKKSGVSDLLRRHGGKV